jgi:hypothetical protein
VTEFGHCGWSQALDQFYFREINAGFVDFLPWSRWEMLSSELFLSFEDGTDRFSPKSR